MSFVFCVYQGSPLAISTTRFYHLDQALLSSRLSEANGEI